MDWNVQGGRPFGGAGAMCLSQHSARVSDVSLERSHRCECDDAYLWRGHFETEIAAPREGRESLRTDPVTCGSVIQTSAFV